MQYLATAKQAKKIDTFTINSIGIPSCVLMERASLGVADCICEYIAPEEGRVLVLCGTGNNGGDGVAAGRILAQRGYLVDFVLIGSEQKASEEMKQQLSIIRNLSLPVVTETSLEDFAERFCKRKVDGKTQTAVIDAIFGIGLSRKVTGEYARWITWLNQQAYTVFSVDVPSGIDATTGDVLGVAVKADYTITFGVNKTGLVFFPGMLYAGKVLVEDIGFPKEVIQENAADIFSFEQTDVKTYFPKRIPRSNKGSYGKLLVIAGSEQISGAALFAAKAAYRMGCGMVQVVSHENNRSMLQTQLPEALYTFYDNTEVSSEASQGFFRKFEEMLALVHAIVIGPGIGQSAFAERMLDVVLKKMISKPQIPVLIDADGLNLLAKKEEYFTAERKIKLPENFVLTPHLKEMSRLLQMPVEEIQPKPLELAIEKTAGATLVLKDARTVISDGTKTAINQSGNNALAKGGSGDVLSGMIGGLLARGSKPFFAAGLGVYLHGLTAEEYVKGKSSSSMLASDILESIPYILP